MQSLLIIIAAICAVGLVICLVMAIDTNLKRVNLVIEYWFTTAKLISAVLFTIAIMIGLLIGLHWWLDLSTITSKPFGQWMFGDLLAIGFFAFIAYGVVRGISEFLADAKSDHDLDRDFYNAAKKDTENTSSRDN
jgi:ascorbate-specific PTS system EIIC-type component UlaA